jgi:rhodanese-related sulfurtransferase
MKARSPLFAVCLTLTSFFAMGCMAWAGPKTIPNLTAPEVKGMIEEGKAVVVHTLSALEYQIQHITGSINIPIIKMETTDGLPKDKAIPLIFYCMGIR